MSFQITDLYSTNAKMYVATDCIIFGFEDDRLKLLLFERKVDPGKGGWSLIGSFVNIDEDLNEAPKRVLKEISGLKNVYLEQLKTYGSTDRDPGFRCISVAQYALIRIEDYDKELVARHGAYWFDFDKKPALVLDHDLMVEDALKSLKRKARYEPLGFELLPGKFTIPKLQQLYEAIYQKELDTRNFRKKVLSHNVLVKLNEKDKASSRKGAFLYKFDHQKYQELKKAGYNFEIT